VDVLEQSINLEGLFRKSGAISRLKELRVHHISVLTVLVLISLNNIGCATFIAHIDFYYINAHTVPSVL